MVKSVGQVGLPPINANNLGYQGSPLPYVPIVTASRDPTGADVNYPTGTEWSNGLTLDGWKLFGFVDGVAQWRAVNGGGGGSGIQSLSDDSGTKAFPDGMGDVQQLGSSGIKTVAGATSITWSLSGDGIAAQYYNVDDATVPGVNPVVPDGGGNVNLTGGQVAPLAVGADVIKTSTYSPHSITFEIQQTDTAASKDTTKNGVSHYNSAQFTSDQGFISLVGGSVHPAFAGVDVDAHTAPGTNPVVADGSGLLTVTGDQVAAGTIGANVIRTDSLAANTITLEVQRSAAAAAPDSTHNGVSHFDSAFFSVDAAGFVQLANPPSGVTSVEVDAFVGPGTNPVVPTLLGQMTVNGSLVAAGTTPIQTISLAANEYSVEVQTSQQTASTDVSRNGLSHFSNSDFIVDANGFVTLKNPVPNYPPFGPDLKNAPYIFMDDFQPSISNYNISYGTSSGHAFYNKSWNGSTFILAAIPGHPGYVTITNGYNLGTGSISWPATSGGIVQDGYYGPYLYGGDFTQIDMIFQLVVGNVKWGFYNSSDLYYSMSRAYFSTGSYSGHQYFNVNIYNGTNHNFSTGVLVDTNWHRYTITYDPATTILNFYIDDVLTNTYNTGGMGAGMISAVADYLGIGYLDLFMFQRTPSVPRY